MKVLVFVEDPGAVNGILPLARLLIATGSEIFIHLEGYARSIEDTELSGMRVISDSGTLLMKGQFDLFLAGTSENVNSEYLRLIDECRKVSTISVGFVDSPANPERRFSGNSSNPLRHIPDYLIVVDDHTEKIFMKFGLTKEQLLTIKHPRLEQVAQKNAYFSSKTAGQLRKNLFGLNSSQFIIVMFCAELSEGLQQYRLEKTKEYTLAAPEHISKRTDVVIFNFLSVVEQLKQEGFLIKSLIRLHPKQHGTDILQINDFDYVSEGDDPIQVCIASDIIIGMNSMILSEAYELRKPVISILPRKVEIEWMPVDIRDKINCCFSKTDLLSVMRSSISVESEASPEVVSEMGYASKDEIIQFFKRISQHKI